MSFAFATNSTSRIITFEISILNLVSDNLQIRGSVATLPKYTWQHDTHESYIKKMHTIISFQQLRVHRIVTIFMSQNVWIIVKIQLMEAQSYPFPKTILKDYTSKQRK